MNKGKILIVDDQPENLHLLTIVLKNAGYSVRQLRSGKMVRDSIRSAPPDLILLDIMMPEIDGYEVCQQLKADSHTYDIPVIFISALDRTVNKVKAFAVGGVDYVSKPFHDKEVLARVKAHLTVRKAQKELEEKNTALVHEIAARKQAEEALQKSNHHLEATLAKLRDTQEQMIRQERLAAVGQLAAGIAHDFRTRLSSTILYAQMASRQPALAPKLARNLETIINESKKAADLVQRILDFSSRSTLRIQLLDLYSFVQIVMDILVRTLPGNIRLSLEVEPGQKSAAFTVQADSGRIQQVLTNLAANARDAMPHGGELRFELSRIEVAVDDPPPLANMGPGAWVCLAISDTGTGMTEEVRAHLFEPFFTTKEVDKGTGLGLAQVYGIVSQHEGYIDAETKLGQGTTFRIYLPAYEEKVQESKAEEPSALPQGQGETILLVENNEALRKAGQGILESLGYRVLVAANGHEALAVYEATGEIDLVIIDITMPEMDGKELVQEMRRSNPNLKALGITSYAVEKVAEELSEAGFLNLIRKPFGVETLARATHHALSASVGRWI